MLETLGWSTIRKQCPSCGGKSFFETANSAEAGKCHKCNIFIRPTRTGQTPIATGNLVKQVRVLPPDDQLDAMVKASVERTAKLDDLPEPSREFVTVMKALTFEDPFPKWSCGLDQAGNTLFWYRDIAGNIVNCKQVKYEGFNRADDPKPKFNYKGAPQVLYGEHQLQDPASLQKPVVLVESEKTAIILSSHRPEYIWLAIGGAQGLTGAKAAPLAGRTVNVCMDNDNGGKEGAETVKKVLDKKRIRSNIVEPLPGSQPKDDLADVVYRQWKQEVEHA